jgi:hypothetical protein
MLMGMIVGLELLLEIPYFLLELLDLVFESLDPLFGIGVLVPSCLLSHESSLDFGYITPHALANSTSGLPWRWSICETVP